MRQRKDVVLTLLYPTDLELLELQRFVKSMVVTDLDAFAKYFEETLDKSLDFEPNDEERAANIRDRDIFGMKCVTLIQVYIDQDRYDLVLPALATLKKCYRSFERLWEADIDYGHETVDALIQAFASNQIFENSKVQCAASLNDMDHDHEKHGCEIEFIGLTWNLHPLRQSFRRYALAARTIRTEYFRRECDELNLGRARCGGYHRRCMDMLEWLQIRAWPEVRSATMLSIGIIMPAEIAEQVFECAMEAEGLPLNPETRETVMVEPPEVLLQEYSDLRARPFAKVKADYCCPGFPEDFQRVVFKSEFMALEEEY